jgi:hypothetical protein
MIATVLVGALGVMVFSILSTGTSLGAKNTATNIAHQQARSAMLRMTQQLHAAVSQPQLVDVNGNVTAAQPAPGIAFQAWAGGPYQITQDTANAWASVSVNVGTDKPFTNGTAPLNQRLIIPGYQVEADITVPITWTSTVNLIPSPTPNPTPVAVTITGTQAPTNYNVACFITNRCYYVVKPDANNPGYGALEWHYTSAQTGLPTVVTLANGVSATPFALAGNNVSINLSSEASNYSNQESRSSYAGFKSTKISLNETVPIRARLTQQP